MKNDYKKQTAAERKAEAKKSTTWLKKITYWATQRFKRADKPEKIKPEVKRQARRAMRKAKEKRRKRNRIARQSRRENRWKRKK